MRRTCSIAVRFDTVAACRGMREMRDVLMSHLCGAGRSAPDDNYRMVNARKIQRAATKRRKSVIIVLVEM